VANGGFALKKKKALDKKYKKILKIRKLRLTRTFVYVYSTHTHTHTHIVSLDMNSSRRVRDIVTYDNSSQHRGLVSQ
jgi:hypothetical protein